MEYVEHDYATYRHDEEGNRDLLANFIARITHEVRFVDGRNSQTRLTISGQQKNFEESPDNDPAPNILPRVEIDATEFAGLGWVMPAWGVQAVVRPGSSIKEDLRTAIQTFSTPIKRTVYQSIGWQKIGTKMAYLHARGAITAGGNDPSVEVRLPPELSHFDLTTNLTAKEGIQATLALTTRIPKEIAWPLIAATLAPMYGPVDFGIHVTGRTGTFKSEIMSLFQSHYGPEMDARHLPGSWSSTPNALEAQAYKAANAAFVIDDFVPTGTSWQLRAYQTTADKIIRAQGNQAGRARLTDTSNLQATMYPRGIVLSTGEDTPEGHSVRARMLILELSPGDIEPNKLTQAQHDREKYVATVAGLAQHLAANPADLKATIEEYRANLLHIGHTRTPGMLARLLAVTGHFLTWAVTVKAITPAKAKELGKEASSAIMAAGAKQHTYLEAADPTDIFLATIRQIFGAGLGHVRTLAGGIPLQPLLLGWIEENASGSTPMWKSRGPCIGWVNHQADELHIDIIVGYNTIKKVAGSELTLTKQTMTKRLKDAGLIVRADEARQRNTTRITAEHHARQVITLSLSDTLDNAEAPNDDETLPD